MSVELDDVEREIIPRWDERVDEVKLIIGIALAWGIILLSFVGWRDWQAFKASDLDKTLTTSETIRCEEDMECWNCETMGNRVCGQGRR